MSDMIDFDTATRAGQLRQQLLAGVMAVVEGTCVRPIRDLIADRVPKPAQLLAYRTYEGTWGEVDAQMNLFRGSDKRQQLMSAIEDGLDAALDRYYTRSALQQGRLFDTSCFKTVQDGWGSEADPPHGTSTDTHARSGNNTQSADDALRKCVVTDWVSDDVHRFFALLGAAALAAGLGLFGPFGPLFSVIISFFPPIQAAWRGPFLYATLVLYAISIASVTIGLGYLFRGSPLRRRARIAAARTTLITQLDDWTSLFKHVLANELYGQAVESLQIKLAGRIDSRETQADLYRANYLSPATVRNARALVTDHPFYQGFAPGEPCVGARSVLRGEEWLELLRSATSLAADDILRGFCAHAAKQPELSRKLATCSAMGARAEFRKYLLQEIKGSAALSGGLASLLEKGLPTTGGRIGRLRELADDAQPRIRLRPESELDTAVLASKPAGTSVEVGRLQDTLMQVTDLPQLVETEWDDRLVVVKVQRAWHDVPEVVNTMTDESEELAGRRTEIERQLPSPQAVELVLKDGTLDRMFAAVIVDQESSVNLAGGDSTGGLPVRKPEDQPPPLDGSAKDGHLQEQDYSWHEAASV